MLMLIITDKGVTVDTGMPTLFVPDKTFTLLLKNPNKAIALRNSYGKNICLGRLGKEDKDGVYREKELKETVVCEDDEISGVYFYGYVKTNDN